MMNKKQRDLLNELYAKFNKGQKIDSQVLTNLYNDVTGKRVNNTLCGSCLRQRLLELVKMDDQIRREYKDKLSVEDAAFIKWILTLEEGHYPDFDRVVDIYNKVFNGDKPHTNCLPCVEELISVLTVLV